MKNDAMSAERRIVAQYGGAKPIPPRRIATIPSMRETIQRGIETQLGIIEEIIKALKRQTGGLGGFKMTTPEIIAQLEGVVDTLKWRLRLLWGAFDLIIGGY